MMDISSLGYLAAGAAIYAVKDILVATLKKGQPDKDTCTEHTIRLSKAEDKIKDHDRRLDDHDKRLGEGEKVFTEIRNAINVVDRKIDLLTVRLGKDADDV